MFANVIVYDYVVLARTKLTKRKQTRGKFRRNFPSTHESNNELYTVLPTGFYFTVPFSIINFLNCLSVKSLFILPSSDLIKTFGFPSLSTVKVVVLVLYGIL